MPSEGSAPRTLDERLENSRSDAATLYARLVEMPAVAVSGEGYLETVDFSVRYLAEQCGMEVEVLEVPRSFLEDRWGADLAKSREYIGVTSYVPRKIIIGRWSKKPPRVHLTFNYDTLEGAGQERAAMAAGLLAMRAIALNRSTLKEGIVISLTPDGHLGGETGAGYLASEGIGKAPTVITGGLGGPDVMILGYKGKLWVKVTARGRAAHGSKPHEGVNAIEQLLPIQQELMRLDERFRTLQGPWPISPPEANRPTIAMCRVESNLNDIGIPDSISVYIDRRLNPEEALEAAVAELEAAIQDASRQLVFPPEVEFLRVVPSAALGEHTPLARTFAKNIKALTGADARPVIWSNYSGMRFFSTLWGASTIGYNPGAPKLRNDQLALDDLIIGAKIVARSVADIIATDRHMPNGTCT